MVKIVQNIVTTVYYKRIRNLINIFDNSIYVKLKLFLSSNDALSAEIVERSGWLVRERKFL